MPATSMLPGVKRPREGNDGNNDQRKQPHSSSSSSSSSHAAIIEITCGITKEAAAMYEKHRTEHANLYQDMDALLSSLLFRHKVRRFLLPRTDGGNKLDGPLEIGVIQLVANDGSTLIFTSDSIEPVQVSPTVGQRVCMGDVILFQRLTTSKDGNNDTSNTTTTTTTTTTIVEFITLDPSILTDAADWCHAASWNVVMAMKWIQKLLSYPPGLAQFTCIMDSLLGDSSVNASRSIPDAWTRSLYLPILLHYCTKLEGVEARKVYQVKKVTLSLLRLYVAILDGAETIITIPRLVEELVYQFIASPLFVEGISVLLPQMAGSVTESAWASTQKTVLTAMKLALRYICRETGNETKWRSETRKLAEIGFFTVLHRITAFWLNHSSNGSSQTGIQAIIQLVEEMTRTGLLRRVTQWVRQRERITDTVSLVDKTHYPPNLQDIKDLHGLKESTVKEMMISMTQTYTPYLRQEALRFVECAMMAAYAELYGPASRAVSHFIQESTKMNTSGVNNLQQKLQLIQVTQPALRSNLFDYSLEEVRLHALFGLPLSLVFHISNEKNIISEIREVTSLFGYIVLILRNKPFIFPVILCNVVEDENEPSIVTATVYVLRDRDILPSLVEASAAAANANTNTSNSTIDGSRISNSLPDAWFIYGNRHGNKREHTHDHHHRNNNHIHHNRILHDTPPQFLPRGTSAVSYVLYILHLKRLRTRLQEEEQNTATGANRVKNNQGKSGATEEDVLWWGSINNSVGSPSDFFLHSTSLTGETEAVQRCITELTDTASLTASQVECLHTLMNSGCGVRTIVGAVGSGKTTLMHASSLSRGRAQDTLRKQHQTLWYSMIKHSGQVLTARVEELASVEEIDDLFKSVDVSSVRDLAEEVTNAALSHIQEHVHLSEKLRCCHAPLLLRPKAVEKKPSSHVLRVLQDDNITEQYRSLEDIMIQSHQRSLNAPLVTVLNTWLDSLKRLGDLSDAIRRSLENDNNNNNNNEIPEGSEWKLYIELLPWIMSSKERRDTLAEAKRQGKTWEAYLSEDLWDTLTVVTCDNLIEKKERKIWKNTEPAVPSFHAVSLPNKSRSICEYGKSEAAGWRAVFGEKQKDLLHFLNQEIMEGARHLFEMFLDVIQTVGATSQTSKVTVVTATGKSLLEELCFLGVWQPRHLVVDDYDQINDAFYLTLSPANVVILSHQREAPLQQEQYAPLAVLKAVQKELQGTQLSCTAVLSESVRFSSAEFHKAVQLCRNSTVVAYMPVARAARRNALRNRNRNNNNNNNKNNGTASASASAAAVVPAANNNTTDGNGSGGEDGNSKGALLGFSSPSCVEIWTHAVSLSATTQCDGLAAAFVQKRIRSIDPSMVVTVFCSFAKDEAAIIEGMMSTSEEDYTEEGVTSSVCTLPFTPDAFVERDEECDVAVLCLSGLAYELGRISGLERQRAWEQISEDALFVERVGWWLWKTVSCARQGAVLIGSKELFRVLEPLQRIERFVLQLREQGRYWLPSDAKGASLALRCPEHENCRQLAILTYTDYRGCQLRRIGVQKCRSLCLASYEGCTNPSHACLHTCHVSYTDNHNNNNHNHNSIDTVSTGDADSAPTHDHCPFPCAKVQPCGHVCLRSCGEVCAPCEFVGLQELTCGQRVVSGISESGPVLTLVHHFQKVRCGETPQPCEEQVTLRCSRCGEKNPMRCCEVQARGGMENATLAEMECLGCVALYNRVAKEFNTTEIKAISISSSSSLPTSDGDISLQELPAAAQEKLQKLRGIAVKKAQLMLQKEALETTQGRQNSEFHQQQEVYNRMREQQGEELRLHRLRVQENIQLWAKKLKQKYEVQIAVNEEMETEVPLMISEAVAEEERQESHLFV